MLQDPDIILRSQQAIRVPDVVVLGLYAVLGDYDFVNIVDAPNNDAVARFSLELGVRAGAHVTTFPAIPISRLDRPREEGPAELEAETTLFPPLE